MKRALVFGVLLATTLAASPFPHQAEKPQMAKMSLKVGDVAPDFTLLSDQWKSVKLSEFRGKKNVFLAAASPLHPRTRAVPICGVPTFCDQTPRKLF